MENSCIPRGVNSEVFETEFIWKEGAKSCVKLGAVWNNWDPVPMSLNDQGTWSVVLQVPNGSHTFQFLVDGEWRHSSLLPVLTNSDVRNNMRIIATPPDANDEIEVSTEFIWIDGGRDVELCAEWLEWIPLPMESMGAGLWSVSTPVPIGTFRFRYLVDGQPKHSKRSPVIGVPSKLNCIQVGELRDGNGDEHSLQGETVENGNTAVEQSKIKPKCCALC